MMELITPPRVAPRRLEQRSEARQRLAHLLPDELRVRVGDRTWRVIAVRDVSPSGISLCAEEALEPGQRVTLVWQNRTLRAEFVGAVAWVAPAELISGLPPRCAGYQVAGLDMHGPQQLASLLLRF